MCWPDPICVFPKPHHQSKSYSMRDLRSSRFLSAYTWLRNTARVEFNKVTNKITLKTDEPNERVHLKYVVVAVVPVGCTRDIPRLIGIKNLSDKSVESRLVPGVVHPKKYKQATKIDRDSNEKKNYA